MALSKTQVSELYVAIFNRASEGNGNSYWQDLGLSAADSADAMLELPAAQEYFGDALETDQAFIEHIYANTLNKTVEQDADGIAYWVDLLDGGKSRGEVVAALVEAAVNFDDAEDEATQQAHQQFVNRVEVSDYTADNLQNAPDDYVNSLQFGKGLDVTSDDATVDSAKGTVDGIEDIEPEDPGVEGDTISLTAGADKGADFVGTDDNDTFDGSIGQNANGQIVNTLSSADNLDGGAGNDTLNASLSTEVGLGGQSLNVQPTTTSVENINIEARSSGTEIDNGQGAAGTVNLDAKDMTGVDTFGSVMSDGDLTIQNVNTLDDEGNLRNTSDITVRMDHTSNFDSIGDASDLTVLFDDDYLIAGEETKDSLQLRIVNNFELAENDSPLVDFDSVDFTVGGQKVSVDISGADTYQGVADAINNKLGELGIEGVEASPADPRTSIFSDDLDSYEQGDLAGEYLPVDIVSTAGDLEAGTIKRASDVADFDGLNTWVDSESQTTDDPVSVNVELEKVGRAGEGGNLQIGGKSQTVVDGQENGIQVFNIEVQGNAAQPSNLGSITSTNNTLETVNIVTDPSRLGSDDLADLTIRGANDSNAASNPFGDNVEMINASGFEGDLTIGTAGNTASYAQDVDTLSATGGGDVEFNANIDDQSDYVYTTGAGNDTINVALDSDAIDATGTGLKINTGGGNDTVTLSGENGGASQLSMAQLENVVVDTGAGDDRVNVESDVNANISTGGGTDFVNINAEGVLNNTTGGNVAIGNSAAYEGEWTFGKASASTTGANVFADQVLYNADLTVTFAGFESTVSIETDAEGKFVASQEDINAAIINAIESDADLARLLQTEENGLNELNVQSLVNGENNLSIDINQPNVVENGATGDDINLNAGDVNALIQGLIETSTGGIDSNSTASDVAGQLVADENNYLASDNGGSTDATTGVNFSTVNLGAGSDDLVAFDSNENSANVLEIDGAFGNASVVNFHDVAPEDVAANTDVGDHALDFTAFLDNQVDTSPGNNNSLSEQDVAVSLNIVDTRLTGSTTGNNSAVANSVNMLRFNEDTSNANAIDWEGLSASNLVAALNGDNNAATLGDGSIDEGKLEAQATANLVGNTQKHIVMIENDQNVGEYKVFELTSTVDANGNVVDGDFNTNATELGTLDFGNSINFQLVGSTEWETTIQGLLEDADGVEGTDPEPAETEFTVEAFGALAEEDVPAEYTIADTLDNILGENTAEGSAALNGATTITASDLGEEGEVIELTGLDASTAGTAIEFDGEATLTSDQLTAITDASLGLTDADAITVTGVAGANVATVDGELGGANDTIEVADDATIMLTSTELQGLNATLAATTPGEGIDATLTVSEVADTNSLTATDLVDTFDVSGLGDTESATIAGLATGDVIETGGTFAEEATATGDLTADSSIEWAFAADTGVLTYELSDNGSATTTASVTLTDVTGVTETDGNFTIA